ncbi:MAG TPA: hypothetical protein ENL03_03280 [Phycisphaerae bacterium]|nr:hypothetical protein [Phycisphaerae bacterium]
MKSHRSSTVLALGVISLIMLLIIPPISLILGIIALVLGRIDLKEMDRGVMDQSGWDSTKVGMWCGIISCILGVLMLILLALLLGLIF